MISFKNNRIFIKGILGLFVVGMLLAPVSVSVTQILDKKAVHAQTTPSTANSATSEGGVAGRTERIAGTAPAQEAKNSDGLISSIVGLPKAIGRWAANVILSTVSAITWAGGTLLQMVTDELVFKMGDWINPK